MERVDGRNGEQVRPLRYHLNPPPDIPLTSPHKEVTTPTTQPPDCPDVNNDSELTTDAQLPRFYCRQ